jgi:hypothetical protein
MLNKILVAAGTCLYLAACASNPSQVDTSKQAKANEPTPGCVADTATRLPVTPHECAAFGHSWSSQDVRNTGQTDVTQALKQIDPSVQGSAPP